MRRREWRTVAYEWTTPDGIVAVVEARVQDDEPAVTWGPSDGWHPGDPGAVEIERVELYDEDGRRTELVGRALGWWSRPYAEGLEAAARDAVERAP